MKKHSRFKFALGVIACLALATLAPSHARADDDPAPKLGYPDPTPIDVCPNEAIGERSVFVLDYADAKLTLDGWQGRDGVKLERAEKSVKAIGKVDDPYFFSPMIADLVAKRGDGKPIAKGRYLVKMRIRRTTTGGGQLFFVQESDPDYNETQSVHFTLAKDDQFHDYVVPIKVDSSLLRLRFDIGGDAGEAEISRLELVQIVCKPMKFGVFSIRDGKLQFSLVSNQTDPQKIALQWFGFDENRSRDGLLQKSQEISKAISQKRPFEELEVLAVRNQTGEVVGRRFFVFNESAPSPSEKVATTIQDGDLQVRFAPDASGAEIYLKGARVAVIFPLVCEEGDGAAILPEPQIPTFDKPQSDAATTRLAPVFRSASDDGKEIEFDLCDLPIDSYRKALNDKAEQNAAIDPSMIVGSLKFKLADGKIYFDYDSPRRVHAPVVRVLGKMTQAVFPGVEYLEEGERSSSTADIETEEAIRYAPPIDWITQPFASIVTDRASVSLLYDDPKAQPVFAAPDFLDGDETTSRVNICAKNGSGQIRVVPTEPIENAILWFVNAYGLPELPKSPYTREELDSVMLYGLQKSALRTPEGWSHAVLKKGPPYAFTPNYGSDFISTIWEITGELPDVPRLDFGGGHIANYNAFLLKRQGQRLANSLNGQIAKLIQEQKKDGSFRYSGKYLKGARYNYASGDCGNKLFTLMAAYQLTGDKRALDAVEKGLAFVNKLPTPAGAQTWELSLHTPDIMGSSRCALANVMAYEATGKDEYLAAARRWAITGIPFVYLWEDPELTPGEQPLMKYATIAVFGATGWVAPNWMGRPVQWCGLDYAYALILLAKHDKTVDWLKIADGIVSSAECQLYRDDEPAFKGLLPDSVKIDSQVRYPAAINPTVVHMLRRMIDGRPTNVSVADVAGRRVVSPYPVEVNGNQATITAKAGVQYDVMIDGKEIRTIESKGKDVLNF